MPRKGVTLTINSLSAVASTPTVGLATQTFNVTGAGLYTVDCDYTIPYIASGTSADSTVTTGGSALQVLVKLNGSTKLTIGGAATNPTPTQPTIGGRVQMQCAVNDVITIVPSSANAVDNAPNAVRGIVNIFLGE